MPGIAFDQAAGYYDRTPGYPEGVAERIRTAIVAQTGAGASARFLELGIGHRAASPCRFCRPANTT